MSNSTYLTVRGKAFWARVFPENKDTTGYEDALVDTGGQYTIEVELDEDSLMELTKVNSQVPDYPRTGPDGEKVYRLKRLHEKYDRSGKLLEWASGAPKVTDDMGTAWDVENSGFLGNTSEVEVKVCVYKAGSVVGTRVEEVKVIDYVAPPEKDVA